MADKTLFQQFADGIANAVADIRHKVVEEPWYGHAVTDQGGEQGLSWREACEPSQPMGSAVHERELSHDRGSEPKPDLDLER